MIKNEVLIIKPLAFSLSTESILLQVRSLRVPTTCPTSSAVLVRLLSMLRLVPATPLYRSIKVTNLAMHVLCHCHLLPGEGEGLRVTPLPGPVYGVAAVLLTREFTPTVGVVLIVRVGVLILRLRHRAESQKSEINLEQAGRVEKKPAFCFQLNGQVDHQNIWFGTYSSIACWLKLNYNFQQTKSIFFCNLKRNLFR